MAAAAPLPRPYEAGRHAQLTELLERLRRDADGDGRGLEHELLRLMAAHALLQGDRPRARALLVDDLRHLVQQPLLLRQRVGEFAELGLVLVRLGGDPELPNLLATLQAQHTGTAVADACAFVGGLMAVQNGNRDIEPTVEGLRRGGDNAFAELLQAFAHERAGEVAEQQAALARAARLSATPLTKALLARAMRAAGRIDEAAQLSAALRREMRTIALRATCRHPIAGPELAFADGDDL